MRSLLRSSRLLIILSSILNFSNIIMANSAEPHVLIAGGGPSGLIASILLNNIVSSLAFYVHFPFGILANILAR